MSTLTSLARAIAVERGQAQPICTVRHLHVSERPLVLIPLALAGEANAPLAMMVGDAPSSAVLLTVPEPRDRDQRFAFAAELAAIVLRYVASYEEAADAPQLLVPNPASIAFIRLLGRSTRFRRTSGAYPVAPSVPVLGRWLTFFSERAEASPSSLLLAMTESLAMHWATGQCPAEDRNLGAILGWIAPPPGQTGAQAAMAAEDPLRCPPAGPVTDPTFDNEILEQRIAAVRTGRFTGDGRAMARAKAALADAMMTQLMPTWKLIWRGVELLRALPPGNHVAGRWNSDKDAYDRYISYLRDGGLPQPRRDSAVAAARRLARLEQVQAEYAAQRALDDPLVMAEYRMTGEAFAGTVVAAEPDRIDSTGRRRVLRPHITVETSDFIQVEPRAWLTSPDRPGQDACVISVSSGDRSTVVLELKGGMGRALTPEPGSVPQVGDAVCYATFKDEFRRLPDFPPADETPWTHGGPPAPFVPTADDAREDWS
jgi:hypothetical protein